MTARAGVCFTDLKILEKWCDVQNLEQNQEKTIAFRFRWRADHEASLWHSHKRFPHFTGFSSITITSSKKLVTIGSI